MTGLKTLTGERQPVGYLQAWLRIWIPRSRTNSASGPSGTRTRDRWNSSLTRWPHRRDAAFWASGTSEALPTVTGRKKTTERIYGRFPSVDQSSRFAGVPNLGKPLYIEKTVHIKTHKTAINHKWNPFIFVGYRNDRVFSHTNPYILNVTQQCRCLPMLIFRAWATCGLSAE